MKLHITSGHYTQLCTLAFFRSNNNNDNISLEEDFEYLPVIPSIYYCLLFIYLFL